MQRPLRLHPDSASAAVSAIAVEARRADPAHLSLTYRLTSGQGLAVPPPAAPGRADELWKHTCLEAFLRAPGEAAYLELNLSPSRAWAAYAFDGYRAGMRPAAIAAPPVIAWRGTPDGFELTADLDLAGLLPAAAPWQAGLSAVIEETSGRTSHWALAHPPGRADFHAPDGFALTLPAPDPA